MNQSLSEDDLRAAHAAFQADHERLRTDLLANLTTCVPMPLRSVGSMWGPSLLTVGASACLAVTLVIWIVFSGIASRPAYALDGIEEKFLQIRSMHVKGTSYLTFKIDGNEFEQSLPIEWYAERSSRYFHSWYSIEQPATGIHVRSGFGGADGIRTFSADHNEKTATLGTSDSLTTELRVENILQRQSMQTIIRGPTTNYQFVGTEEIRGRKTLKYEYVSDNTGINSRSIIWLNPATGLPTQSAVYEIMANGRERCSQIFETIEFNAPAPAGMFPFIPPEGYRVIEGESRAVDFIVGAGEAGNEQSAMRQPFAIDRLAVLVCWCHNFVGVEVNDPTEDDEAVVPVAKLVSDSFDMHNKSQGRECELHPLHTQVENGKLWRWSLAVPLDRRPLNPNEAFSIEFKSPFDGTCVYIAVPLRLEGERLKNAITRLKGLGTPAKISVEPEMTLTRLRWLASRYLTEEADNDSPNEGKK